MSPEAENTTSIVPVQQAMYEAKADNECKQAAMHQISQRPTTTQK
jgi:hypothetical protein